VKNIAYSKSAFKYLKALPAHRRDQIVRRIEDAARGGQVDAVPLKGAPGHFRLRVGDWRVIWLDSADTMTIKAVGPRGDIYK
jgi:mRNA interferase RelE/StbE